MHPLGLIFDILFDVLSHSSNYGTVFDGDDFLVLGERSKIGNRFNLAYMQPVNIERFKVFFDFPQELGGFTGGNAQDRVVVVLNEPSEGSGDDFGPCGDGAFGIADTNGFLKRQGCF